MTEDAQEQPIENQPAEEPVPGTVPVPRPWVVELSSSSEAQPLFLTMDMKEDTPVPGFPLVTITWTENYDQAMKFHDERSATLYNAAHNPGFQARFNRITQP